MTRLSGHPRFVLGPILFFRGEQGERWRLSALFVIDGEEEPDDLRVDGVGLPVPPRHLAQWRGRHLWRFDFAVPRGPHDIVVSYGFPEGESWRFTVPARRRHLRLAYASCNGTEQEGELKRYRAPRNALWSDLLERHAEAAFHVMLHGGDQLYADAVWRECPSLVAWKRSRKAARQKAPFTPAMAEEAMGFYFDLYLRLWSQPEVAAALASIPSVMMWDDHDVFDGWGSLPDALQQAPVARGVYLVARRHFALFQLAATENALPECVWGAGHGTFTQGFRLGDVGILAPDLRSERAPNRVLSPASWEALPEWLDRFDGCRNLVFMSSVPLVFPSLGWLERLLAHVPGHFGVEDDLRDQWRSPAHAAEWRRMVELLTAFALRTGCRVTAVSGEIHTGGRAVLRGGGMELWQLIASGIVHPPPGFLHAFGLNRVAGRRERPMKGYTLDMPPFVETGRRLIRARNWLSLDVDTRGQVHAQWHVEGTPSRYLQVI